MNALIAFAAMMGVGEPALPFHATIADALVPLALLLMVRRVRPLWWALPYLAWAALSVAVHRAGGWKLLGVAELVCVAALAASLDDEERRRVVRAWVVGAAVLATVALVVSGVAAAGVKLRWAAGGGELAWSFRPKGLAASTNLLASLCLLPFLVAVAERRWWLASLFAVTMLLSRSILAAALGLCLLWKPRGWKWLSGGLVLAALASMVLDVHGGVGPGIRWRISTAALRTIGEHPLFGVGPAALPASAGWPGANDPPLAWAAHSTALDVAATLGLPALVALVALVARALRRASSNGVLLVALWASLFDALTLDVEHFRHLWLLLGLTLAGANFTHRRQPRADATLPIL